MRVAGSDGSDVPPPGGFGLAAVEADAADARVRGEESGEIVDADRVLADRGIEAAGTDAARDDVPERDAPALQGGRAARIGRIGRDAADLARDAPELVVPERVVLAGRERGLARHAAEDEDAGAAVGDRGEALGASQGAGSTFELIRDRVNKFDGDRHQKERPACAGLSSAIERVLTSARRRRRHHRRRRRPNGSHRHRPDDHRHPDGRRHRRRGDDPALR